MIYTIISKLPFITSDKSNKRFFKIFVFGSLLYVLLHYYLFQKDHDNILDTVKIYIYYAMALDFCVAYGLDKFMGNSEEQEEELPNTKKQIGTEKEELPKTTIQQNQLQQQNKFTPEQRAEYERKYTEWKKQQQNKEKNEEKYEAQNEEQHEEEIKHEIKRSSSKNNSKDDENTELSLPKVRKNRSDEKSKTDSRIPEDTDILPRYKNKNT